MLAGFFPANPNNPGSCVRPLSYGLDLHLVFDHSFTPETFGKNLVVIVSQCDVVPRTVVPLHLFEKFFDETTVVEIIAMQIDEFAIRIRRWNRVIHRFSKDWSPEIPVISADNFARLLVDSDADFTNRSFADDIISCPGVETDVVVAAHVFFSLV